MRADALFAPNVPDSELPEKVSIGGSEIPAPPVPVTKASLGASAAVASSSGASSPGTSSSIRLSSGPEIAPLPPSQPNDVHVQVDAPFVFNAKNRAAAALPAPVQAAKDLPMEDSPARQVHLDAVVQSPPPEKPGKAERHGFFRRVGGFFGGIFK